MRYATIFTWQTLAALAALALIFVVARLIRGKLPPAPAPTAQELAADWTNAGGDWAGLTPQQQADALRFAERVLTRAPRAEA